jgi:hypothetical protein
LDGRKPSAVENIIGKRSGDGVAERESSSENPDVRTNSREGIMLDVRLANGTIESFNYSYLTRIRYTPGDSIELVFGDVKRHTNEGVRVQIEGRRLGHLRQSLAEHRRRFIQEGTEAEDGLKPEEEPHIDRIQIEERKDEE